MVNAAPLSPSIQAERLSFRAETNPFGGKVDLIWEVSNEEQIDDLSLFILRRERRFPGRNRRGVVPVAADNADLTDGVMVYDSATFSFDFAQTTRDIDGNREIATTHQYRYTGTPRDRLLVRTIRRESIVENSLADRITIRLTDAANLSTGTIYYYTAFFGTTRYFNRLTQASALVTAHGYHHLFAALPQIHQSSDDTLPDPDTCALADRSKGQLQRLMEVFDLHADLLQGMTEGLRDLHNPRRVDSRFLPLLAQDLGWKLRDYLDEDGQRNEIGFAPQVYKSVGTIPNIVAIINRLTGWDAHIREYSTNVLRSFDTNRLEKLEDGTFYLDDSLKATENYQNYLDSPDYQDYLSGKRTIPPPPPARPWFQGHRFPMGSIDTRATNADALFKLKTKALDDPNVYSYDCGQPDVEEGGYKRNDKTFYNRETIGIYLTPDVDTEFFSPQESSQRIAQVIKEFLPIQVRALLFVRGIEVEEPYQIPQEEEGTDVGVWIEDENYDGIVDSNSDRIPGWRRLISNDLAHRSIDTVVAPIDTSSRTWHTGIDENPI
jgi:Phage tail protein (Tail_P2_I)